MKKLVKKIKLRIAASKLGQLFANPIYELRYRPYGGDKMKLYTVLKPLKQFENGFLAHALGKGLRRFKSDRIVSMEVISLF